MTASGRVFLIADVCSTCVCDGNRQVCMKLLDSRKRNEYEKDALRAHDCCTKSKDWGAVTGIASQRKCENLQNTDEKKHRNVQPLSLHGTVFIFFASEMVAMAFHCYCSIMWLKFYSKIFHSGFYVCIFGRECVLWPHSEWPPTLRHIPIRWVIQKRAMKFSPSRMHVVCAVPYTLLIRTSSP